MSTTGVLHGIPAPENRWRAAGANGLSTLETLVYRSNLLGADRALANIGGGNTSAKETLHDHVGRRTRVLWVKGSGTDSRPSLPGGSRPFVSTTCCGCATARRWTTRRWSTTCSGAP